MQEKEMFSVGELAKKLNISVRTVQYYDQINLLSPSSYTEGGRRLYSLEDYIVLYQILSLKEMGFTLNVGPEGEFFLFYIDDKGRPIFDIHDQAGYFDLSPSDRGEEARKDIMLTMKKVGFKIEAAHHEVAPGQHEVDFKYDDALTTADNWMTFKDIVKNIAKDRGLYATFMPKPFSKENGNAMHCNQSLFANDDNVFYDPNDPLELSTTARYYIGGLLKHAKAITAICNPTINSYKRLLPGYEAPTNIAWSTSNRSTLLRIPATRGKGTRVELRNPDPTANPYLVFAVMLRAGLDGIKNKIEPPEEVNENIFSLSRNQQKELNIEQLPRDLQAALDEMRADSLVKQPLGEHVYNRFINAKQKEWDRFNEEVHAWEVKEYLANY